MTADDVPTIFAIEERSYEFPWSAGIFHDCLRARYSSWVAEIEQRIVAYGVMSLAVQECHILNLCVDPYFQRQGIGRCLLEQLLTIGRTGKADTAFLEVRPTNIQALALYFSAGFHEIGSRRNYYPALFGREDAIILARAL